MNDFQEQQALPLSKDEFFPRNPEDPKHVCHTLKVRILSFIADIEELLKNPLLADHLDFLDTIASHLVSLQSSIISVNICSDHVRETGVLVENILRCMVLVQDQDFALSTLDAAKIYRRNRKNSSPLATILKAYPNNRSTTESLLSELKLLVADLTEEKENI